MKIKGNSVRQGMVLEHNGELWIAVRSQHTMPGKGGAYQQVELKNVRTGSKLNERFRATEVVERVRLDQGEYQYLYGDENLFTVMNTERIAIGLQGIAIAETSFQNAKQYANEVLFSRLPKPKSS